MSLVRLVQYEPIPGGDVDEEADNGDVGDLSERL